jgi:hypothetical protein
MCVCVCVCRLHVCMYVRYVYTCKLIPSDVKPMCNFSLRMVAMYICMCVCVYVCCVKIHVWIHTIHWI